ncbi:MAG: hypothetical protein ABSG94_04815 [Brevinematales bacterium]|jgi:hypothetical protein
MYKESNTPESFFTAVIGIIIALAVISLFTQFFPVVLALLIIAALIPGISMLYRLITTGSAAKERLSSRYDEHGSRRIKASVIEMKDADKESAEKDKTK